MNDYGIFANAKYEAMVDSRFVAEVFEKNHQHVMEAIRRLISEDSGYSSDFRQSNFRQSFYINEQNKKQPCYVMTRDGFTALVMGFTGKKADQFKEAYIKRFNEMEEQILYLQSLREQHPQLTEAIKAAHDAPEYRKIHNIPEEHSIRSYLSIKEIELLDRLQTFDIGFVIAVPDFQQRKQMLEYQAMKWREKYSNNKVQIQG